MANSGTPVPLPSHIHYELLLQLLEQQTMAAVYQAPAMRTQVQQLISTLRKALSQQRQIEEFCKQAQQPVEYQWSTNQLSERFPSGDSPV
ncbi:MAG: hypothetical protein EA342_20895 [Leptolyngbya sp. LCM1.Bin17]|jgi:hypothetical protein|nr:MAG: hypothetical protein EA342_20895 [Leptolyngbya sp. LCM1.Bin17]